MRNGCGNRRKSEKMRAAERRIEEKFWDVLKKYKDIFSKKPGRISIYEHELKIKDD